MKWETVKMRTSNLSILAMRSAPLALSMRMHPHLLPLVCVDLVLGLGNRETFHSDLLK